MAEKKKEKSKSNKPGFFARLAKYFRDAMVEFKKIVWPSTKQVWNSVLVVLVMVVIFAVATLGVDLIFSSLQVLARTEAAAIEANVASPCTTVLYEEKPYPSKGLNLFPSTRRKSGLGSSLRTALCMPVTEAQRIFSLSISSGLTASTAQATASFSMMGRSRSLSFSVICFESSSRGWWKSSGRMTAAA